MTDQPFQWDRIGKVLLLGIAVTIMAQALGHAFGAAFDSQVLVIYFFKNIYIKNKHFFIRKRICIFRKNP